MAKNKDAYYFRHDSNARFDQKILKLRTEFGWEGYGIYWAIIESMRENSDYKLQNSDIKSLSFSLHLEFKFLEGFFEKLVNEFELLILKDGKYYSKRLLTDMKHKEHVSSIRSAIAKEKHSKTSAKKRIREDNIRIDNIIKYKTIPASENNTYGKEELFNYSWSLYPKKDGRKAALSSFRSSVNSQTDFDNLLLAIENYKQSDNYRNGFVKNGSTFFNNWQDWIEAHSNGSPSQDDYLEPEKF